MEQQKQNPSAQTPEKSGNAAPVHAEISQADKPQPDQPIEKGGRKGPEPTRYGDWELNGKCVDF
ncbi:MAG TPA: DUF1674 domain-containing protein [Micavibrio sp.]